MEVFLVEPVPKDVVDTTTVVFHHVLWVRGAIWAELRTGGSRIGGVGGVSADVRLARRQVPDVIGISIVSIEIRETHVPDIAKCTLDTVTHPWSIGCDIFSDFVEVHVQRLEVANHPPLDLYAVTVVVVEHPDEVVIIDALMRWCTVGEPVGEVVEESLLAIDHVLLPCLLVVTDLIIRVCWVRAATLASLVLLEQMSQSVQVVNTDPDLTIWVCMCEPGNVDEVTVDELFHYHTISLKYPDC